MQKKLTLSIDEAVYEGLHRVVGRGNISHFIEDLVRPCLLDSALVTVGGQHAKGWRSC